MENNELKRCCTNCTNLKYWRKEEADCCSYALYRCKTNKREVIDDFHIDYKCCRDFSAKPVKKNSESDS